MYYSNFYFVLFYSNFLDIGISFIVEWNLREKLQPKKKKKKCVNKKPFFHLREYPGIWQTITKYWFFVVRFINNNIKNDNIVNKNRYVRRVHKKIDMKQKQNNAELSNKEA